MTRKVAATTMAGLLVTGVAAPAWANVDFSDELAHYADEGVLADQFGDDLDDLHLWVADEETRKNSLVVVTPGTADTGLGERTAGLTGNRDNWIVKYPQSIWPVSSGTSSRLLPIFAPTYDQSKGAGVDANLAIMRALKDAERVIVYTGYSQGADALGNAAEHANAEGLLDENDVILLVSDPRGPWGLKPGLQKIPGAGMIMALVGAENDGARDPEDTGEARVVQVIVKGDPVANWQWDPLRPVSSLLVDAAGFITIHAGTGKHSYANLRGLELEKTLYSAAGNTTYEVYDTYHPLALLNLMIAEALGLTVSDEQLDEWDRQAERFYPLQDISPETAAPGVRLRDTTPETTTAKHRLLGSAGDQVEAPVSTSGTGTDTYEPRHAAPYEPRHAAPEVEETGSGDQASGGTEVPETETETGGSDATGSDATGSDATGSDAAPETEAAEPEAAETETPAAETTVPDAGSDTTDGEAPAA